MNKQKDDWTNISKSEEKAILIGLKQLGNEHGIPHKEVMSKIRKRYSSQTKGQTSNHKN